MEVVRGERRGVGEVLPTGRPRVPREKDGGRCRNQDSYYPFWSSHR